ncbi:unnamed protein product [Rotaria sordida]|uniref:Carbonic anhydrase n=1 Tax=Rotaria sordida TaxID=392033 RepID=A0A815HW15_9BILA|nr:unnamed protein product [Rotaria sordida]CAF3951503.1 unnamed protein product [Rotaria sordida]
MSQFILIIILLLPIIVELKEHWSYENITIWSHDNRYCGGNLQSPIDLRFNKSHIDRRLKAMYLQKQNSHDSLQLINNGHTAQLNLKNHFVLKNVAPASEDYRVEQIHFHWGHANDDVNGSEHLLEGRSYPLEMHMVTYSSWFSNIHEAMSNTRALAVVGVFFELSFESNSFLQPIISALGRIRDNGKHVVINENFNLKALIGEKRMRRYYRYDGSLTTPPCYESVIWSVLQEPLQLSSEQLQAFQRLHGEKSVLMKNTYRTIQSIGSRKLFRSFTSENIHDDEIKKQISSSTSYGQYLSVNMKFLFVLMNLLMLIA